MGRYYLAATAVFLLPGCCVSAFAFLTLPHTRASFTVWPSRLNPGPRRRQPLRVLASSSDTTMQKQESPDRVDAVASYSPIHADMEQQDPPESADATPYTPRALWWTKSREEETKTLNLAVNAGFLAGVVLIAGTMFLGVDSDVSRGWTAGEVFFRVPLDNWAGYTATLRVNPILVKACTSGTVYALGDWVAQTVEGIELADIKRGRVLRSALAGLLLHGPLSHVWYGVCEQLFDTVGWNGYWWVPVPKVITDQLFWGPLWNGIYITVTGALKRDSFETIKEAVTSTAIPLVLAGLRLWPLAHLVTYGLISTENRVLWVDAVEILWVTILSKLAAEKAAEQEAEGKI